MTKLDFSVVQNYYRRLVVEHIVSEYGVSDLAQVPGALEDVACLALNRLPPRYVRHKVDAAFYLDREELGEMQRQVRAAVQYAVERVAANPRPAGDDL